MIRLSATFSKKVPGNVQYSSDQASASVEVEIAEGNAGTIQGKLAELWTLLRNAVDQQLQGQTAKALPAHHEPPAQEPQPQHQPRNGHGQASKGAAVSDKQMKFIRSLVGELKPMGVQFAFVEGLAQRLFQRSLDHLDRAQASTIIGHLQEIKAGKLQVQHAA